MNYGAGTLNSLSQDLTHRPTSVKSTLIVIFYGNRIPKKGKPMLALKLSIAILFTLLMPLKTEGRNAEVIWDSRCEACHGDNARLARKYLLI
jgi:hypothetical protein